MTNPRQSERQSGSSSSLTRENDEPTCPCCGASWKAWAKADREVQRRFLAVDALLSDEAIDAAEWAVAEELGETKRTTQVEHIAQTAIRAVLAAVASTGTGGPT